MLSANKEKLNSFFQGSNQFKIPFFQRAYVWKSDNWNELWEDVLEELKEKGNGNLLSEHFIGTIIIKQAQSEKLGTLIYDLIDGQQRLTTICLLLRALHDSTDDTHLRSWIYNLLVFKDSYGQENIRIVHSKVDSSHFSRIILSNSNNDEEIPSGNKITEGYLFFRDKITKEVEPKNVRSIVEIVLEKLPVIHMALALNDDVQQIFDTINSLGVKLTAGELLKNHLFSFKDLESRYEEYWQSIFEVDEESVMFWNKDKTSGRIVRSTIELFLYSFLVIIKESSIKMESLFKEYKETLKDKSSTELLSFAKDLSEYAQLYEKLPDGEDLADITFVDHEKRFFHLMNELEITTVFPLVLFLYKEVNNLGEREKILRYLESYLVRRTICKLTTKNYNNLFISILIDLKRQQSLTAEDFKKKLLSYEDDTNRFPSNTEFQIAFSSTQLINKYSKEVLYCIALYQLNNNYQDNLRLDSMGFTVEHIMPKKWRNNWTLPPGKSEWERDSKLLTLGNLTLIKGRLNSSLRDAGWKRKSKELTQYSTLRLTTDYVQEPTWDEDVITKRGQELFKSASLIWDIQY